MIKLIVLDRDGVINEDSDQYVKSPQEFVPIKGSLEAIASLNSAGYTVVVATNQSGIARGLFTLDVLEGMHQKLNDLLGKHNGRIDKIYFCPHGPEDNCDCRKPLPGMLEQILKDYPVEPGSVIAVGDSLRDLQAAKAVGMVPVLVRTGKGVITEPEIQDSVDLRDLKIFDDLQQLVNSLLN